MSEKKINNFSDLYIILINTFNKISYDTNNNTWLEDGAGLTEAQLIDKVKVNLIPQDIKGNAVKENAFFAELKTFIEGNLPPLKLSDTVDSLTINMIINMYALYTLFKQQFNDKINYSLKEISSSMFGNPFNKRYYPGDYTDVTQTSSSTSSIKEQLQRIIKFDDNTSAKKSESTPKTHFYNNFTTNQNIQQFITKCLNNTEGTTAKKRDCQQQMFTIFNDMELIKTFEEDIKDLSIESLTRIAKNMNIDYKYDLYESEIDWNKHNNLLYYHRTEDTNKHTLTLNVTQNKSILNMNNIKQLIKTLKIDVEGTLTSFSEDDPPKITINTNPYSINVKNAAGDDDITVDYTITIEGNDEKIRQQILTSLKDKIEEIKKHILTFVKVISHTLNENLQKEREKVNEGYNSIFRYDTVNTILTPNSIMRPTIYYPYLSPFIGGKFEFKPNKNQTADILERMFNMLINNLKAQNKYLIDADIKVIKESIDKLRELESFIAELITNGFNLSQDIKDNKDYNKQQITAKKILDNNINIQKTNEKIKTLREKIDYVIGKMYEKEKEEEEKKKKEKQPEVQII